MDLEPLPQTQVRWLESLPEAARRHLPPAVWAYVHSGARDGTTTAEATAAWRDVRFRTRVLRGVSEALLETEILGQCFASPIGVAPSAMQRAVHPSGERGAGWLGGERSLRHRAGRGAITLGRLHPGHAGSVAGRARDSRRRF